MHAYFYDNEEGDQRKPHNSGMPVSLKDLNSIGINYMRLGGTTQDQIRQVDELCRAQNYKNRDEICISPERLENYEEKIKTFFAEHIHEDEEVRFILEGTGYFDVRDKQDRWVRIAVEQSDLLIIPAGIYHRFTLDENNYIKAMRIFKEDPKWTPINRPEAETNKYRTEYLRSIGSA
ncbi:1,2-dihydroxy-3-keto-5-methylthiopentene dioxygenase [Spiromyces aspiralis]|uniref:1,2-dihydroxy-3-keto-5-methylthiopentene dioxygenase n=1 Tax=Spiromyces aspiralis TaxID=68401 RepID=A0ACC1HRR2_9FUNG|nr:1,2-dihydroxy-3-keto-5-methylthiopentene dioxygenase [Spiromyces aspiralis]